MPYLRGEPLTRLLDAVQDNILYLKLVFDEDEEHPELGDAEVSQNLVRKLQRLVDSQVHCLFINEWNGPQFVRHRLNIFNRIWARFGNPDHSRERWARLLSQAHGGTVDSDTRTVSELLAALPPPEEVETQLRSLLALAEECAEEGVATVPRRPDMRALRRELDRIAAEQLRRMWSLHMTARIIRRNLPPASPRRRFWITYDEGRWPRIRQWPKMRRVLHQVAGSTRASTTIAKRKRIRTPSSSTRYNSRPQETHGYFRVEYSTKPWANQPDLFRQVFGIPELFNIVMSPLVSRREDITNLSRACQFTADRAARFRQTRLCLQQGPEYLNGGFFCSDHGHILMDLCPHSPQCTRATQHHQPRKQQWQIDRLEDWQIER
ncbi:hypothetical protein F4678DRAFT_467601 [Xylaria arbuscula]|nr:hypothetical protein F4678DRAFT_467601 [Xylaria arbuscula]